MKRWVVTGTSMVIEAENAEEAVERADQMSGWHWEATEVIDPDPKPTQSAVVVRFQPEAWINDNAVPVDTDWDQDTWRVSVDTAVMIRSNIERDVDLDFVRDDPYAPRWVKEWSGPFTITMVEED